LKYFKYNNIKAETKSMIKNKK